MKLENQVRSLEQAIKLKELGIVQDSLFYYNEDNDQPIRSKGEAIELCKDALVEYQMQENGGSLTYSEREAMELGAEFFKERVSDNDSAGFFSAYTVAELGVILPDSIPTNSNIQFAELVSRKDCLEWRVGYDVDSATEGGYGPDVKSIYKNIISNHENEAQCRADMLIWLLQQNRIDVEDCNKRLTA